MAAALRERTGPRTGPWTGPWPRLGRRSAATDARAPRLPAHIGLGSVHMRLEPLSIALVAFAQQRTRSLSISLVRSASLSFMHAAAVCGVSAQCAAFPHSARRLRTVYDISAQSTAFPHSVRHFRTEYGSFARLKTVLGLPCGSGGSEGCGGGCGSAPSTATQVAMRSPARFIYARPRRARRLTSGCGRKQHALAGWSERQRKRGAQ